MNAEQQHPFPANKGKDLTIKTDKGIYTRYPIKTQLINSNDCLTSIVYQSVKDYITPDDILFISEKVVAITQGRAFPISEITPSPLAKFLTKFVHKSPYGIGLGMPETMELAIKEVGVIKILLAALCAGFFKVFGIRGVFYKICGNKARAIDGPCEYTIPPYNNYAKLAPFKPNKVAKELETAVGCPVFIIDANDLGVEVLGRSTKAIDISLIKQIFKDNPLGQCDQQTPIAIVRKN